MHHYGSGESLKSASTLIRRDANFTAGDDRVADLGFL